MVSSIQKRRAMCPSRKTIEVVLTNSSGKATATAAKETSEGGTKNQTEIATGVTKQNGRRHHCRRLLLLGCHPAGTATAATTTPA